MTTRSMRQARAAGLVFPLAVAVAMTIASCAVAAAGPGGRSAAGGAGGMASGQVAQRAAAAAHARDPAAAHGAAAPAQVIVRHFVLSDGAVMTAARFTGGIRFALHCGTLDPGPLCRGKVSDGQKVNPFERGQLIAAFNGGFKLSAGAGGYEQQGRILSPLRPGLASLVIYRSGQASIGVWGHGAPLRGQQVYSVRQNLVPLVLHGQPTAAAAGAWTSWGATITGADNTARSAIGQNAAGQLIYVASMSATPPDLANALVRAGAVIGMELDINIEWVQFDYARLPGGHLIKGITGQYRPAAQYLTGWTRDFIAVLANVPALQGPGTHAVP